MRSVGVLVKVIVLMALLGIGYASQAASVARLYEAEVGMAGADEQARGDAELRALEAVLIKLTGTRNVDVLAALALHDGPLRDLIEQFQARGGDSDEPRRLWVKFDERRLDGLLARSQIPVWGRTRPLTAVLLGIDDGQSRRMLAAGDTSGFAATLDGAASSRGIPMVLPLMDLRDARNLRPDALLSGSDAGVKAAAERYRGEAVVYGALAATASGWRLDWTLQIGDERRNRSKKGAPNALLELLANAVADELAARFMVPLAGTEVTAAPSTPAASASAQADAGTSAAPPIASADRPTAGQTGLNQSRLSQASLSQAPLSQAGQPSAVVAAASGAPPPPLENLGSGVPIDVLGVRSVHDYGTVLDYLRTLDFVEHVHVRGVQGDTLSLSVNARGGAGLLRQTLDIGHTLRPVSGDARAYQLR